MLLYGEPGIGKTSLLRELVQAAELRGIACLVGRADSIEAHTLYFPWRALLQQLLSSESHADVSAWRRYVKVGLASRPRLLGWRALLNDVVLLSFNETPVTRQMAEQGMGRLSESGEPLQNSLALRGFAVPHTRMGKVLGSIVQLTGYLVRRMLRMSSARDALTPQERDAAMAILRLGHIGYFQEDTLLMVFSSVRCLDFAGRAEECRESALMLAALASAAGRVPMHRTRRRIWRIGAEGCRRLRRCLGAFTGAALLRHLPRRHRRLAFGLQADCACHRAERAVRRQSSPRRVSGA